MKKLVLAGIYLTGINQYVKWPFQVASAGVISRSGPAGQFNLFSMAAKKLSL